MGIAAARRMHEPLDDRAFDVLFREARTYNAWLDKPVEDGQLRQLYDLMKWAPTSANSNPVRLVFIRTERARQRLLPALAAGNIQKVLTAPVTAIIAYDVKFFEKMPKLFPHNPRMRDMYANAPELVEVTARRNSSLQGAYFILAALAWTRMRPALRVRQRQSRRRVLRRRPRVRRLRPGVLPRRPRQVQLPLQRGLWGPRLAPAAVTEAGVRGGVYVALRGSASATRPPAPPPPRSSRRIRTSSRETPARAPCAARWRRSRDRTRDRA